LPLELWQQLQLTGGGRVISALVCKQLDNTLRSRTSGRLEFTNHLASSAPADTPHHA